MRQMPTTVRGPERGRGPLPTMLAGAHKGFAEQIERSQHKRGTNGHGGEVFHRGPDRVPCGTVAALYRALFDDGGELARELLGFDGRACRRGTLSRERVSEKTGKPHLVSHRVVLCEHDGPALQGSGAARHVLH